MGWFELTQPILTVRAFIYSPTCVVRGQWQGMGLLDLATRSRRNRCTRKNLPLPGLHERLQSWYLSWSIEVKARA